MTLQPDPIIIYGAPRSGTTYLTRILNAHPQVHISHEIRLFVWVHRALKLLPANRQVLASEKDRFLKHLATAFPDMIRDFYRRMAPHARYWGDKNPYYASRLNTGCLNTIVELFPSARFIHIIRDGRDVVSSLIRQRLPDGRPWIDFETAHMIWSTHVELGQAFGTTGPENHFELRYEDLIADDVTLARRIFNFLRIELASEVLEFCQTQKQARTPFSYPARDLSGGVAHSDWATVLNPEQQLRSLELLGNGLVQFGYETAESLAQLTEKVHVTKTNSARVLNSAFAAMAHIGGLAGAWAAMSPETLCLCMC